MAEKEALKFLQIGWCEGLVAAQAPHGEVILVGSKKVAYAYAEAELAELITADQASGIQFAQVT
ncbi:MAG: hypothetical protein ACK55E_06880 [Cyanobacteriota bacterium]